MPPHLADKQATAPLQVKVPTSLHFTFKAETLWHGTDMSRVTLDLITLYAEHSDDMETVMAAAREQRVTLGTHLAGVLALCADDMPAVEALTAAALEAGKQPGEYLMQLLKPAQG